MASLLTAEMAAKLKAEGKTLCQRLDELFRQYGCHTEGQLNIQMPGEKGMDDMRALMARVRAAPPEALGGMKVVQDSRLSQWRRKRCQEPFRRSMARRAIW